MIPQGHRDFVRKILADHDVPTCPRARTTRCELIGWTAATATPQVEIALQHDKVKLIANALGTPPPDIIEEIHASGRLVAALCGSPTRPLQAQERRRRHHHRPGHRGRRPHRRRRLDREACHDQFILAAIFCICSEDEAVDAIVSSGPSGAIAVAGVATAIVIALWFAFYLFVFLPRSV